MKLTAAEVLYMADGALKRCDRCVFWHSHADRCALIDPEVPVLAAQVCGLYVNGPPMTEASAVQYSKLSAATVGLGRGNTACGNCEYGHHDTCGHPDLDGFPIDQKGGCCNAWEGRKREANPNHDPHSGEFTSGGGVATVEPPKSDTPVGQKDFDPELVKKAIAHYGATSDLDEAGYLLPNGQLLDLSGKNNGGQPGQRGLDHRDVAKLFNAGLSGGDGMTKFMTEARAVRLQPESHYGASIMAMPNTRQIETIVKAARSRQEPLLLELAYGSVGPWVDVSSATPSKNFERPTVEAVQTWLTAINKKAKLPTTPEAHEIAEKHKLSESVWLREVDPEEFDPLESPTAAAERAARVARGEVGQEDVESAGIDAAQRAADDVRDWVNTRLDTGARAVATLYKKNRDGLLGKIKHIYNNFLGDDQTLVNARKVGALDTINRVISEHADRLATEVGDESVRQISSMVGQHPSIVERFYSPVLGADLDIPTPKPYQTVLGELTTSVVGGGTYFDRLLHVNQGMKDQIFHATRQSLIAGSGFEPLQNSIHRIFGVDDLPEPKSNAYGSINTYENEARRQWNALMDETGKRSGQKSVWFSMIPDPDTTPGCAARHGNLIEDLDSPPPRHANCFVPETRVEGAFLFGTRFLYSGKVVKIRTANGRGLTVTPNHPVLTNRGFVPAGGLKEGDHLVCRPVEIEYAGVVHQYKDVPTRIDEVFESIRSRGGDLGVVRRTSDNFHGDAAAGQSDIEVVSIDSELLNHFTDSFSKNGGKLVLETSDLAKPLHSGSRPLDLRVKLVHRTASGYPSGAALAIHETSVFLNARPLEPFRVGPPSHLDAAIFEVGRDHAPGDSRFITQMLKRFSEEVALSEVVNVCEDDFVGHVYDLQSLTGLMVADGIVTSNCRCEVLVVDADWDLDEMQAEAASYLKTQGYTIDSALAEESQERKRFKHVLREAIWIEECLENGFDPDEHPRDAGGRFAVAAARTTEGIEANSDYVYHATNEERAGEIAVSGIKTHGPSFGTDQSEWPDGSREKRSYFAANPKTTESFAPEEGKPVFLRIPRTAHPFRKESTGDFYARKTIPAKHVEYLGEDKQWHPLENKVNA